MAPPRWVETYLAIPFVDRGRSESGCDCFGLVRLVLARKCLVILTGYGFIPCSDKSAVNDAIRAAQGDASTWVPMPIDGAQPFDVVPMTDVVRRQDRSVAVDATHVGIMVTARHVLHTQKASGPVCLDISHPSVVHRFNPQSHPLVYRHRDLCK